MRQKYIVKLSGSISITNEPEEEFQKIVVIPVFPNSLRNENGFKKIRREVVREYQHQKFTPLSMKEIKEKFVSSSVCEVEFLMDFEIIRSDSECLVIMEDRYDAILFENERSEYLPNNSPLASFSYGVYCFKIPQERIMKVRKV